MENETKNKDNSLKEYLANKKRYEENEAAGRKLFWSGAVIATIALVLIIFGFNFGTTSEGTVNFDTSTCKESISLNKGDWQTYFGKFVCNNYFGDGTKEM